LKYRHGICIEERWAPTALLILAYSSASYAANFLPWIAFAAQPAGTISGFVYVIDFHLLSD